MRSEVVIYHDETGDFGSGQFKGHVLLFVPTLVEVSDSTPLFGASTVSYSPSAIFSSKLAEIRELFHLEKTKFHFTDIAGTKWRRYDLGTRIAVEAIVDALRHKRSVAFSQPLCFKLAVMIYPKNSDLSLYGGDSRQEKGLRHKETILRILLKGAAHYLYSDFHRVTITQIVSDGQPDHRRLSEDRIIAQLSYEEVTGRQPLREYVTFSSDATITHISSDHKDHEKDSMGFLYANYLQMADLSIGAGLRGCNAACDVWKHIPPLGATGIPKKDVMAYPFREMMMKTQRGKAFERSGHFRSFVFSQVQFSEERVIFTRLGPERIKADESTFHLDYSGSANNI